jgi:large subunit ribosomal protein L9
LEKVSIFSPSSASKKNGHGMQAGFDNTGKISIVSNPIFIIDPMAHAEIILTESVPNLGAEADVVKVRRGYARNFLLPTGKAIPATRASVRQIHHLKVKRAEREALEVTAAEDLIRKINKLDLSFTLETGQSGKAFGSVTAKDVTDKILALLPEIELPRHAVVLDKGIKETGEHEVVVKVHHDVSGKVKVVVKAPTAPAAEADESGERPAKGARKPRSTEEA